MMTTNKRYGFEVVGNAPTANAMPIKTEYMSTTCPHCDEVISIDREHIGEVHFCFYCGNAFQVRVNE